MALYIPEIDVAKLDGQTRKRESDQIPLEYCAIIVCLKTSFIVEVEQL